MLHPARKLFFNLFLTVVSASIAILVAVVEVLGCVQVELNGTQRYNGTLNTTFWNGIADINNNFEYIGYSIMAFFAISTLTAVAWFKCKLGPQLDREIAAKEAAELAVNLASKQAAAAERKHQDRYIQSAMLALATGNRNSVVHQPSPSEKAEPARESEKKKSANRGDGNSNGGNGKGSGNGDGNGSSGSSSGSSSQGNRGSSKSVVATAELAAATAAVPGVDAAVLARREKERAYIRDHMLRAARGGN